MDIDTCLHKKRYRNERLAGRAARYYTRKSGIKFTAYRCPVCYWWHLTSGGFVGQPEVNSGNIQGN